MRGEIEALLAEEEVMNLATASSDAVPMVHGMHYVADGLVVYTTSLPKTQKLANIAENPTVSYTVYRLAGFTNRQDSRTVQVKGTASEVQDEAERKRVVAMILEKMPWAPPASLKHNVMIRIDPIEALWTNFTSGTIPRQIVHFE